MEPEAAMQAEAKSSDERIAYALLRIVVGTNLLMHCISRTIGGTGEFAAKLVEQFSKTPLPAWSVWSFGLSLPAIEGMLGLLLLIGLRTRAVLIASSLLILMLTFGSALLQDWTAASTQLLYALVYSLLLFLHRYDGWSVDRWMTRFADQ
jgi:thiosulfate dehydrogenase [quinone] large subunit